jgi:hypothetical protein
MARRKQASLHRQITRSPVSARRKVAIDGRCSIGGREAQEVLLTDLGLTGCRMRGNAVGVIKSDSLELWLGDTGPIAARLEWTRDGALGVSFETPIEAELLDSLCETSLLNKVVPLRK